MKPEEIKQIFPQWSIQEIKDLMRNSLNEDLLFRKLSERIISDAQLAVILSNEDDKEQISVPEIPAVVLYPDITEPPPVTAPRRRRFGGGRTSENSMPLLENDSSQC